MKSVRLLIACLVLGSVCAAEGVLPLSAPVTIEVSGVGAPEAVATVFRVFSRESGRSGTCFLHRSGRLITAAHVVETEAVENLRILLRGNVEVGIERVVADLELDLAILIPDIVMPDARLELATDLTVPVGTQVSAWGFPEGYSAVRPMLTVGYIAGVDEALTPSEGRVARFVVNAAFNRGNSGGPLLRASDGKIVGVVCSKVAPIPPYLISALEALKDQKSGFTYTAIRADGSREVLTEGRVVAQVLEHLRLQTQLVVGHAASASQLSEFLKKNGVEP